MLIPEPELSPDLEWLLQSPQGSPGLLIETTCREYGAQVYRLAEALVGKSAGLVLHRTLLAAVRKRQQYRQKTGPRLWILSLAIQECHKIDNPVPIHPSYRFTQPAWEANLWSKLDGLDEYLRLPAVLYLVSDLTIGDIAFLLTVSERDAWTRLNMARQWLAACLKSDAGLLQNAEVDIRVRQSLQARWPLPEANALELVQAGNVALRMVDSASLRLQRALRIREIILIGFILILVVGGNWLTRQAAAGSQTQVRPLIVTRIMQVMVTRTPGSTQAPTPTRPVLQSLLFNSTQEIIRQRMNISRSLWPAVYVEAQLVRYGPPGYIGPPRIYRNQAWIQNPTQQQTRERMLVLTGSSNEPSRALLVEGGDVYDLDLSTGQTYKSVLGDLKASPLFNTTQMFLMGSDLLWYSSFLDGSALMRMLFAATLAPSEAEMTLVYYDRMLSRDTLVLETEPQGIPLERFWVDANNGMVLRWEHYGDGKSAIVTEEIVVTTLDFEAVFPDQVLSSTFQWRSPLEWDVVRRDAIPGRSFANPLYLRTRLENQALPPPDFDITSSPLSLQWSLTGRAGLVAGASVEIYSGIYRLGSVKMGNPWNVVCKRSQDGKHIAFLEPTGGEQSVPYYAQDGPYWVDLTDSEKVHNAFPNAELVSSDFNFSHDGQMLAFWGCAASSTDCGIYIHDLQTRKNRLLEVLDNGATYFLWNPDGSQLGFFSLRSEQSLAANFLVLNIEDGRVLYESLVSDWPYSNNIPVEAPQWARDASQIAGQRGLTGCLLNSQPRSFP